MTERKEPIKLCSQCRLSDPTQEQSTAKPGGTTLTKMTVLLIPYWRINCEVVPLTVLKCNILNYSSNCYTKVTPQKIMKYAQYEEKKTRLAAS